MIDRILSRFSISTKVLAFVLPFVAGVTAVFALIALILTGIRLRHRVPKAWRSKAARRWHVLGPGVKLKQIFSLFQVWLSVSFGTVAGREESDSGSAVDW